MARVVCVHGIGQQHKGPGILRQEWAAALLDGVTLSGELESGIAEHDIQCVFYGDMFRPAGRMLDVGDPWLTAADIDEYEAELLADWWDAAAASDPGVIDRRARSLAGVPGGCRQRCGH